MYCAERQELLTFWKLNFDDIKDEESISKLMKRNKAFESFMTYKDKGNSLYKYALHTNPELKTVHISSVIQHEGGPAEYVICTGDYIVLSRTGIELMTEYRFKNHYVEIY